jgi:hypothetical protein
MVGEEISMNASLIGEVFAHENSLNTSEFSTLAGSVERYRQIKYDRF